METKYINILRRLKSVVIKLIALGLLTNSCKSIDNTTKSIDSTTNRVIIEKNGKEGYYNDRLSKHVYGLYDGIYSISLVVIFENSMLGNKIKLINPILNKTLMDTILIKKTNINVCQVIYPKNNSSSWDLYVDGRKIHHIDELTYRKYKFLVVKNVENKGIVLIYTNDVSYDFYND